MVVVTIPHVGVIIGRVFVTTVMLVVRATIFGSIGHRWTQDSGTAIYLRRETGDLLFLLSTRRWNRLSRPFF